MQGTLADGTNQGGDRHIVIVVFDLDVHPPIPLCPAFIEMTRHFDLIGCRSVQSKFSSTFIHHYYYQYQSGFLSEEGWFALRARLRSMLQGDPFSRYLIVVMGDEFRESFVVLANSLLAEIDGE